MTQYRIVFHNSTHEEVTIEARDDDEACDIAAKIHAAFRDPPDRYEVWDGDRHVYCGGGVRVPTWLPQQALATAG